MRSWRGKNSSIFSDLGEHLIRNFSRPGNDIFILLSARGHQQRFTILTLGLQSRLCVDVASVVCLEWHSETWCDVFQVRRALAWKLRHRVEHRAADWGLDVGTVALAVTWLILTDVCAFVHMHCLYSFACGLRESLPDTVESNTIASYLLCQNPNHKYLLVRSC